MAPIGRRHGWRPRGVVGGRVMGRVLGGCDGACVSGDDAAEERAIVYLGIAG